VPFRYLLQVTRSFDENGICCTIDSTGRGSGIVVDVRDQARPTATPRRTLSYLYPAWYHGYCELISGQLEELIADAICEGMSASGEGSVVLGLHNCPPDSEGEEEWHGYGTYEQ
jgi:hypothetical protein